MQHHLKVHFLPQAQFHNSKIMVPLHSSSNNLKEKTLCFKATKQTRKLRFKSKLYLVTFGFSWLCKLHYQNSEQVLQQQNLSSDNQAELLSL